MTGRMGESSHDAPDDGDPAPRHRPGGHTARAALRAKRIALGAVIIVAFAFIGSSAWQIIPAVFGAGFEPIAPGAPGSSERECALGIRKLLGALDRAAGEVAPADAERGGPEAALHARLSPEWDEANAVARTCERAPGGLDAWAALERMRMGEDQLVRLGQVGLGPMRVEVAAHLPPDLR